MPYELVLSNDVNGKKTLYRKLHKVKGKEYTFKQFKKFGVHKATIYKWLKNIEQNGNCNRKCESRTGISKDVSVIKMFDHLIGRVHMANQNGLQSLQKIWN